ncbi:putative UDP-rhamnose:rhamnosyltransferase 1 [Euphorbia lathyris]|uniref:putative UDP-rhamnose:rhamnosyltransferase 1 n=1 Tax=Euphorbia lathyris TaxID=212925 RepID=UPI003313A5C7
MGRELRIMMLPWCGFGHLIPFFRLSIALAKSGVHVSFISTPKNIYRLPKISPNLQTLIQFIKIPMPILEDGSLLEHAEATSDIPTSKIDYLKIAYDLLQHPLKKLITQQKPDWLIIDGIPHWITEIAQENQVPLVYFSIFSAAATLFLANPECLTGEGHKKLRPSWESLTSKPDWIDFPSSLAYRKNEAIDVFQWIYSRNASGVSDAERIYKILSSCQVIAIRTCTEIEGDYLNKLQEIIGKSVIPVGLLHLEKPKLPKVREINDEIFKWLDEQKAKSVVYVGFGSEYMLSKDQVFEIAHGLELSGLPFLWALRKPNWAKDDLDSLPPGFSERTCGKGIVSFGWVPQMEILGHLSIGGTLIHCGWGSVTETLQFGHCLILLPFVIDQPLNAKFLVEKGLGVEVERNEDGSFSRDGIAKALRMGMVSDESKDLRACASEAAQVFGNEKLHQDYYIAMFVQFLKSKEKNVTLS